MKLHLPSSLRKALLACLAALVVPSFTTLASGSSLFGAAVFSYLAASSVAQAEVLNLDEEAANYEYSVSAEGQTVSGIESSGAAYVMIVSGAEDRSEVELILGAGAEGARGTADNVVFGYGPFGPVKLVVDMGMDNAWQTFIDSSFDNIDFRGEGQIVLKGSSFDEERANVSILGTITNGGNDGDGKGHLVIDENTHAKADEDVSVGRLDMRSNSKFVILGNLKVNKSGIMCGDTYSTPTGITLEVGGNVTLAFNSGITSTLGGTLTMTGDDTTTFTKKGSGLQTIKGLVTLQNVVYNDGGLTFEAGGSARKFEFDHNYDIARTLTLGGDFTVRELYGKNNTNNSSIVYSGEGDGITFRIESDITNNETANIDHAIFGEKVKLVINSVNAWAVFKNSSFYDIELEAGEIDLRNSTVHGDLTATAAAGVKAKLTVGESGTVTIEGDVNLHDVDLRGGSTTNIWGDLTLTESGINNINGNNETLTVGKVADDGTVSGGNVTVTIASGSKEFKSGTTFTAHGLFTKNGDGTQKFSGTANLNGGLTVNGGTMEFVDTTTIDGVTLVSGNIKFNAAEGSGWSINMEGTIFSITGNVSMESGTTFTMGRGILLLGDGIEFDGTLTIDNSSTANGNKTLLAVGENEVGGSVTIKSLEIAAGNVLYVDHPGIGNAPVGKRQDQITIQDAVDIEGKIIINASKFTLAKGGALTGGIALNWGASLVLGDDLLIDTIEIGGSGQLGTVERMEGVDQPVHLLKAITANEGSSNVCNSGITLDNFKNLYKANGSAKSIFEDGRMTAGVGVGVNFASDVTIYHIQGGGTLNCPLRINGGTLTLSSKGASFDMRGAITGTGNLEIWTEEGDWNAAPSLQVKISGGGDLDGLLKMNSWGSRLTLASDFEVGGIDGASALSSWAGERRWRRIDSEGDEQRTLTLDVVDGAADIDADVMSLTFGGNILLHKTGAGTQRIQDVSFGTAGTDSVDIWVDEGELIIGLADGATITGDITVTASGSLKFMDASGNATDMTDSTINGNFTWDKNDAEGLGALTVTGTLTVGSLVPDLSTDDPDDTISRAETNVLSLSYGYGAGYTNLGVNKRYLSDIKIESGTLDISLAVNGGYQNGAITYFTSGTLSGEGEGGVLKLRRTAESNDAANYTAVLQLKPDNNDAVTFNGTLAFADDSTFQTGRAGFTYASAELSLAHGNLTLGCIDTTDASGAIGFTAGTEGAAQTIDVLRAIKGTHNLRFGRSSSGVTGAASPFANAGNAVVGVVNLREAGTISGHLYLGNLLNGALRTDPITLNIGNGKTLSVGGLAGYGAGGIGVWDSALLTGGSLPSDAAATLLITGTGGSMQHVNIASNVTLRLANNASQTFATATAGHIDGSIELGNNSTLTFGAGTYTIKEKVVQTSVENGGSLTDAGNFEVRGSVGVTLEKGGEIGGYLWVSSGATLYMGADVTAGGLSASGVTRAYIVSSSTVVGNVTLTLDVAAEKTYTLNVTDGEFRIGSTTENGANNNVAFVKKGTGTQAFGSYVTVYGKGGAHIQDGVLEYKAGGTIKQHLWGDGTVVLSGGTLTLTAPTVEFAGQAEENYLGTLEVKNGVLQLDRDLTVHDLRVDSTASSASAGNRVSHSGTATTLTIDVAQGEYAGNVQRVDETGAPIVGSGMVGAAGSVDDWHLYMSGVTLVKAGDGTYSLRGLTTTGDVQVTGGTLELANSSLANVEVGEGSTLLVDYGTEAGNTTLSGKLQVAATGLLQVNAATLSLTQGANADFTGHTLQGKVDLTHAGVLELGANMQVAGLLSDASTTGATGTIRKVLENGTNNRVGADVSFTIHVADAADTVYYGWYNNAENTNAVLRVLDGVKLVKTGAGTQVLHNLAADEVVVTEGALRLGVGSYDNLAWGSTNHFALGHVSVDGSTAVLELGKAVWNAANGTDGSGTRITLSGGATLKSVWSTEAVSDAESNINLGTLELGAATVDASVVDGHLVWSTTTAADTTESWDVYKLTGKGNLEVGSSNGHGDKVLNVHRIDELAGTLSGGGNDVAIYVGEIHQSAATGQGAITADVYSKNFRKTGDGDFSISHLTIGAAGVGGTGRDSHLYMDYTGTLDITTLDILTGATLHYTTGQNTNLINWEAAKLLALGTGSGVYLDISDLVEDAANNTMLANGISLGITGKSEGYTIEELKEHLRLVSDLSYVEWDLAWGEADDYLYLKVTGIQVADDVSWDSHWGLELLNNVPNDGEMETHAITTDDLSAISGSADEFTDKVLALVGSRFDDIGSRTYIKLTAGDTAADTKATVVGGAVYHDANAAAGVVSRDSFILLDAQEGSYHMLVGGSSCVAANSDKGGFSGNTHIEMTRGSVDYVIGGNHVTNREFAFAGDTYISIDGGTVRGGVVGGSTLTRGADATEASAIEFLGNSHLFIYTPLGNANTTPGITTGSNVEHIGFTAVVGGNAWIEMPNSAASAMSPLFRGSSTITIALDGGSYDMFDTARKGNFDKAIVGGNYTAAFTGSENNGDRSTRFEAYGDGVTYGSQISIYATEDTVFSGGVNGASRRASGGSGSTLYEGDTMVQVNGGTYTEAIAGGFWFESTAVGSHESTLTGNTNVVINSGHIWRVIGGSYSLGGGADSNDSHVGNSSVSITGGSFDSSYGGGDAEGQLTLGFIAGGDFYRNNAGGTHSRTGNTSVSITGGDHFNGIHIVGGDYANFYAASAGAAGANAESIIEGVTSVILGGNEQADAFSITGFVVGGSYLTDQGKQGSITIQEAVDAESSVVSQVIIGSGVELHADVSEDHDHAGIAAVAGSAIVIERGTQGSAGEHSAVIDGDTSLVLDGGLVTGHLVGGSYTNEAAGTNSLSITGTVNIDLISGSVTGNVYGGHYSQNTDAPDQLTLNGVNIQLKGATVQGNIIGGSHREATKALTDTPPTQGSITIDLMEGSLMGNVYAAGEHTAAAGEALHVTTSATTVNVHAGFEFAGGLNGAAQVVSGGYSKANAADESTVNARNGSTGGANLVFVDEDGLYEMSGVSFYDFDRVVNAGDVVVYGEFRVLDRGASTTLRKEGAGHLSLLGGLRAADGSAYTGKLVLSGGTLALGDDLDLDKMAGVVFDLTGRTGNTKDSAWLQSDGGQLLAGGLANIEFTASGNFKLRMGSYFLIDELNGGNVGNRSFEDFFTALGDDYFSGKGWLNDGEKAVVEVRDGSVVLRVFKDDPNEWYWQGGDAEHEQVWDGTSDNWSREGINGESVDLTTSDDVHFNAGASSTDVQISGTVTPGNIYVDSGDYTFTQKAGDDGEGIAMDGILHVGSGEPGDVTNVSLELENKKIPKVELNTHGSLTLGAEGAIQHVDNVADELNRTQIDFNGGTLVYGELADGSGLAFSADVSSQVVENHFVGSTIEGVDDFIVRIQVGDSTAGNLDLADADGAADAAPLQVVWDEDSSGDATNWGIQHILTRGIEKSGRGELMVKWTISDADAHAYDDNIISSVEGLLVLEATVDSTDTTVSIGGAGVIDVNSYGSVQLVVDGDATLKVSRAFAGTGTVIIGAEGKGNYEISGSRPTFAGCIQLLGNSSTDSAVLVKVTDALGGKNATLELHGRGLQLSLDDAVADATAPVQLGVGTIRVADDTLNYVGATAAGEVVGLDLTGALQGSGTLAAAGAVTHVLSGDLTGFDGTLHTADNTTVWRLAGTIDDSGDVAINYTGSGSVVVDLTTDTVRLLGTVGGSVNVENAMAGTTLIIASDQNTSTGSLVFNGNTIQLGDAEHAAVWKGVNLEGTGTGGGTFVLAHGALQGSMTSGNKKMVTMRVETIEDIEGVGSGVGSRVDLGGNSGTLLDEVYIKAGGRLTGVTGDMVAGNGANTSFHLVLTGNNFHSYSSTNAADYLISAADGGTASISIGDDGAGFIIDFSTDGLVSLLLAMREQDVNGSDGRAFLHLLYGGSLNFSQQLERALEIFMQDTSYGALLTGLGFKFDMNVDSQAGEMAITGSSKDVYLVLEDDDAKGDASTVTKDNKADLAGKKATVVAPGASLDIVLSGDDMDPNATVNNLVGVGGGTLHATNENSQAGDVTIELNNSLLTGAIDGAGTDHGGLDDVEQVRGQNTTFEGTILGDEGVNFRKTGSGTLTVGRGDGLGGMDVEGSLVLNQGRLNVEGDRQGQHNEVGALEFAYDGKSAKGEQRGFRFAYGTTTTHDIVENSDPDYTGDDLIIIENDGQLIYGHDDENEGSRTLTSTSWQGDGTGTFTVHDSDLTLDSEGEATTRVDGVNIELTDDGSLHLVGATEAKDSNVTVQSGSSLTLEDESALTGQSDLDVWADASVSLTKDSHVNSSGSLTLHNDGTLTVDETSSLQVTGGATIDGALNLGNSLDNKLGGLSGSGSINGTGAGLTVVGEGNSFGGTLGGRGRLTVDRQAELELNGVSADGSGSVWGLDNEGRLTVDASSSDTTLGDVHLGRKSDTTLRVNTDGRSSGGGLNMSEFTWDDGASLTIESAGTGSFVDDHIDLGFVDNALARTDGLDIQLSGAAFLHYDAGELSRDNSGRLSLGLTLVRENRFLNGQMDKNETAGADMFWNASSPLSSNWRHLTNDIFTALDSDLYRMVEGLSTLRAQGRTAELGKALAAGAGASISVLGSALSQDVERQLKSIRNRTVGMSPETTYDGYDMLPEYHVWLHGEGSFHKLEADGSAPGYSLNSWGGTLGMDAQVSRDTTVGVALSALYGNLKASAPDTAKGNLDTTYLSAFARVADGAWLHTFVMTGGVANVKLDRTVDYGSGSYRTKGSTDGYALAALYEVGYSHVLNAEGTSILQTVFNAQFRHATISGYTESGSDAGLKVDDISHNVFTLGAGLRTQSMVGETVANRTAIFEARALVKADIGDRSGTAMNQLIKGDGTARELESAEIGAVGIEIGAGLTVPLGAESGSLFMDVSAEMRRGYTNASGSVGYRFSF